VGHFILSHPVHRYVRIETGTSTQKLHVTYYIHQSSMTRYNNSQPRTEQYSKNDKHIVNTVAGIGESGAATVTVIFLPLFDKYRKQFSLRTLQT